MDVCNCILREGLRRMDYNCPVHHPHVCRACDGLNGRHSSDCPIDENGNRVSPSEAVSRDMDKIVMGIWIAIREDDDVEGHPV